MLERLIRTVLLGVLVVATTVVAEIHVSPDGDDGSPGTKDKPLRTLEAARDAVRRSRGEGGIAANLKGGRYFLAAPLALGEQDSGTKGAPVVYRAAEGATVVVDGGARIDALTFRKVTEPEGLARLHPTARGQVWAADLRAARQTDLFDGNPLAPQISFCGQMLRLARWPNSGYAHIGKVHDVGAVYARGRTRRWPMTSGLPKHRDAVQQCDMLMAVASWSLGARRADGRLRPKGNAR